jgi:superfamily II DNA or RNA helicase
MVVSAVRKGVRVMFICNRTQLIEQSSKVFDAAGVSHGILQGDNTRDLHEQVLIASIQTIAKRGFPIDIGFVVVDEAHFCAGTKQAIEIFRRYNNIPIIGLSATPFSKGLGKIYDFGPLFHRIVSVVKIKDLIDQGYLADCDIYAPSRPDMKGCKLQGGDYSDKDAEERSNTPKLVGDILTHWMKLSYGKQTVVFASSIAHSRHIVSTFQQAGIVAEHIDCYMDMDERRDIMERFESGEIMVLSNPQLLSEGWDCPACHTMILARPTKSLIRYLQQVGRVLRPHESKRSERGMFALILDHSGSVEELGLPTDDLPLVLDTGKPKTAEQKKAEKKEKLPKPCTECHYIKPAGVRVCPACGHSPHIAKDVDVEQGELSLVKGKSRHRMPEKQETYSGLIWYSRSHQYSEGWAAHKYRELYGVWPNKLNKAPKVPSEELFSWIKSTQIRHAARKAKHAAW